MNNLGFMNFETVTLKNLLALFPKFPKRNDDFKKIFVL